MKLILALVVALFTLSAVAKDPAKPEQKTHAQKVAEKKEKRAAKVDARREMAAKRSGASKK